MRKALHDCTFPDYVVPQRHRAGADEPVFVSNRRSAERFDETHFVGSRNSTAGRDEPVFFNNRRSLEARDELPSYAFAPRLTAEDHARREAAWRDLLEHQSDFLA